MKKSSSAISKTRDGQKGCSAGLDNNPNKRNKCEWILYLNGPDQGGRVSVLVDSGAGNDFVVFVEFTLSLQKMGDLFEDRPCPHLRKFMGVAG